MNFMNYEARKFHIIRLAAETALHLPRNNSGFWFHGDLRDNYYFAVHLFAYCTDRTSSWTEEEKSRGALLAEEMLLLVLGLQDRREASPTYGHWPLNLGEDPLQAQPHPLPVELMGCLMLHFYERYQHRMSSSLRMEMNLALLHLYQSPVYKQPLEHMNHHEAKHTALKLLLGRAFGDEALLQEGKDCARRILNHIRTHGFKEYASLPWHWHWIQAFTCVWELVEDPQAHELASELLDYLWSLRAQAYLRGAWAGANSRVWPHDAPKDLNCIHDYIQFGDFPAPQELPRLEGAALLSYQVSENVRRIAAMEAGTPARHYRTVCFASAESPAGETAHLYLYRQQEYALGGIWERRDEFDNEQIRWKLSLPLDSPAAQAGVNQLYFFHPGRGWHSGDDRHASPYGEVLLHENALMQLWDIPPHEPGTDPDRIIGCLPKGAWQFTDRSGYGQLGRVFIAFHLLEPFTVTELEDRWSLSAPLCRENRGRQAIILEAMCTDEAAKLLAAAAAGLSDWAAYHEARRPNALSFHSEDEQWAAAYTTCRGAELRLILAEGRLQERRIDGSPVSWLDYPIF